MVWLCADEGVRCRGQRMTDFAWKFTCWLAWAGMIAVFGCRVPDALRERVMVLPPYEQYAEALRATGLDSMALGRDWLMASDSALRAPYSVTLPFREQGVYRRDEARALAIRFSAQRGERIAIQYRQLGLPTQMFIDLYQVDTDSAAATRHRATATRPDSLSPGTWSLVHEVRDSAQFILRVQPELLRDGRYELEAVVGPILAFPVEGGTNRSAQSFFGADRDGGRRSHHGVDIFAPRGTPALAATDGVIRSIRPNDLGGNVVWLRDAERGINLYYAHLDTQIVVAGQRVSAGDTLGFVGNTGNARTTKPHLHFGIYARGPVDPWPWVRQPTRRAPNLVADTSRLGQRVVVRTRSALLRARPADRADSVRTFSRDDVLTVVGANGAWYRVSSVNGESGYLPSRSVITATSSSGAAAER